MDCEIYWVFGRINNISHCLVFIEVVTAKTTDLLWTCHFNHFYSTLLLTSTLACVYSISVVGLLKDSTCRM